MVVSGYRADLLGAAVEEVWPGAEIVHNPEYATTGSMRSLALARRAVDGAREVLVAESDLIVEDRGLPLLLVEPAPDVVLASGPTGAGDEVWICGEDGRVREIAKAPSGAHPRAGELVGLSRLSASTLDALVDGHRAEGESAAGEHYEERISRSAAEREIRYRLVPDLAWGEIDAAQHLERVRREVLPRLTPRILLTPGPATTSDRVREVLRGPDLGSREAPFSGVVRRVRDKLLEAMGGDPAAYRPVLLPGPGTAAVEGALTSLTIPGDRVLVLENGAYGGRAAAILEAHGIEHDVLSGPWTRPLDVEAAREALRDDTTHMFWVHHETTTGVLNPLGPLVELARERGVRTVVDAMSSFGGVDEAWADVGVDALASSANKCIQGLPGVAFVLCRAALLERAAGSAGRRPFTLDLVAAEKHLAESGQFRFTPPVQVVQALEAALDELLAESVAGRAARYTASWTALLEGAGRAGLQPLVEPRHHSRILTAFHEPEHDAFDYDTLHADLRERGVTLYPGKLPDLPSFRVGNLGAVGPDDLRWAAFLIQRHLERRGIVPGHAEAAAGPGETVR